MCTLSQCAAEIKYCIPDKSKQNEMRYYHVHEDDQREAPAI